MKFSTTMSIISYYCELWLKIGEGRPVLPLHGIFTVALYLFMYFSTVLVAGISTLK